MTAKRFVPPALLLGALTVFVVAMHDAPLWAWALAGLAVLTWGPMLDLRGDMRTTRRMVRDALAKLPRNDDEPCSCFPRVCVGDCAKASDAARNQTAPTPDSGSSALDELVTSTETYAGITDAQRRAVRAWPETYRPMGLGVRG